MLSTRTSFEWYSNPIAAQNKFKNMPASKITKAIKTNSGVIEA
jgi:hypothetical protein